MSTRSRIGILKKNGSIESIYCYLDGYSEWLGRKLYRYYNDIDKINSLINLGDISHLESNLEPNSELPHKFGHDTEQKDVVVAYNRDRNEDWKFVKPLLSKDLKEFEKYCLDSDDEAFESLKDYFINNGFDEYKESLKDNIIYLEEDKKDLELGKLYNEANNLLKELKSRQI